jgi:integral membrane protein
MAGALRTAGYLEALSWLVLLGAMWMKYGNGVAGATRYPGLVHGALFMAYACLALVLSAEERWERGKLLAAIGLSVIPFGTLVFDRRYLRGRAAGG